MIRVSRDSSRSTGATRTYRSLARHAREGAMDLDAAPEPRPNVPAIILAGLVATAVAAAGAYWWGHASAVTATPGPTSAEAGFARDMQVHHLQGVDLAMIVRDRSEDPDMRRMAYD